MLTIINIQFQSKESTGFSSDKMIVSLAEPSALPGKFGKIYRYSVFANKAQAKSAEKSIGTCTGMTLQQICDEQGWKPFVDSKGFNWLYPKDYKPKTSQPKSSQDNLDDLPF